MQAVAAPWREDVALAVAQHLEVRARGLAEAVYLDPEVPSTASLLTLRRAKPVGTTPCRFDSDLRHQF